MQTVKHKKQNHVIAKLEYLLAGKSYNPSPKLIADTHDELVAQLHDKGPTPDWDDYPLARQFFLSHRA